MIDVTNHIGILYLEFFIPDSGSLKAKRRPVKSFKDRLRNRYNVSVAEIGALEKWQRSLIGICAISRDKKYLDQEFQRIVSMADREAGMQLTKHEIEFI